MAGRIGRRRHRGKRNCRRWRRWSSEWSAAAHELQTAGDIPAFLARLPDQPGSLGATAQEQRKSTASALNAEAVGRILASRDPEPARRFLNVICDEAFQRAICRRLPTATGAVPRAPLEAHARWITQLREYIYDGGACDPGTAARDDLCALGRWLYGVGDHVRRLPAYKAAQTAHAGFHECAGDIVALADQGRRLDAERSLSPCGPLRRRSIALVAAFNELNRVLETFKP